MHIIYFDRHDRRHTIKVSVFTRYLILLLITLGLGACFYSGYFYGLNKNLDHKLQNNWVSSWQHELKQVHSAVGNTKLDTQINLDAFSDQVAKLQAHVARLDALGLHLSKIAKLDPELFNFNVNLSEKEFHDSDSAKSNSESSIEHAGSTNCQGEETTDFFKSFEDLSNSILVLDNQLNLLQSVLKHQKLDRQTLVKGKPIKYGYISSYYGYRNHPIKKRKILHRGVDFVSRTGKGTPILSVASGVISWSGKRGGYGNMVEINHGDGYFTRYAHNSELLVKVGDLVNKGDEIAKMGSTGNSTGNHVHFEVWRNGKSENPITYLSKK